MIPTADHHTEPHGRYPTHIVLLLVAGLAAGTINAVAGGGSLVTFPALLAVGLPAKTANFTNSVAVSPGYLASVYGSWADLDKRLAWRLIPTTVIGAVAGCLLLIATPAGTFELIVPFLVIAAALALAVQQRLKTVRAKATGALHAMAGLGAVYGGYFGAALGVMLVAALGLVIDEPLVRINALKNAISAVIGVVTVVVFAVIGTVDWAAVGIVAPSTLAGGYLGARVARRLPARVLRAVIVTYGLGVGVYLLFRAV
jgi:uncharacterized membrane protein YfcA